MKRFGHLLVLLVAMFPLSPVQARAPSVSLVAPNGSVGFVAPAAPLLYATAAADQSVPGTSIARVEFLDGASIIGALTAPNTVPAGYAFVWAGASVGAHQISVRATDSLGNTATSTSLPIYIVAADPPPRVTLTAPLTGQLFVPTSVVPLAAVASSIQGSIQRVEFIAGSTIVATAFTQPFAGTWTQPPAGNWTVVARAFDDLGVATASPAAYIQVLAAPRPPAVVVTAPAAGSTINVGTPLGLAATALAPDGSIGRVDFYAGSALVGSAATSPYRASWAAPTAGTQSLTAKAIDVQGNSTTSTPVLVTVGGGPSPVVSLVAPLAGTSFSAPATISLSASASVAGGSIAKVEFLANGIVVGSRTVAPFAFSWTAVPTGTYTISARATSNLGSVQTSALVSVSVATNAPPSVVLIAPSGGQTVVVGHPVTLAATAADTDGTIAKVEFLLDGMVVGSSATTPYSIAWAPSSVGAHAAAARAIDNAGAVATSAAVGIVVTNNVPPTVALAAPLEGQAFAIGSTITLLATASDSDGAVAKVEFLANGAVIGTANAAPYRFAWTGATSGDYTIVARATDDAGTLSTSSSRSIKVAPLALNISEPAANATVASDFILLAGTFQAPPNSGITVNGLVARKDDNGHFFINNFPLVDGVNSIVVTLTASSGQTVTQTLTLMRSGIAPMQVTVDSDAGFAPSAFTVRLNNRSPNTIVNVAFIDLAGSQTDLSGADQQTLGTIRYAASGVFRPGFRITDSAGNTYTQYLELMSQDMAAVEAKFTAVWQDFANALGSGDKELATKTLVESTQAKYGAVFDALGAKLPAIVSTFAPTGLSSVSDGIAELVVRRVVNGKVNIFLVYFVEDSDGVWRLDSM